MHFAKEIVVFMALWASACVLFDYALKLTGAWLMLGGAATYFVCEYILVRMRSSDG